MPHSSGGGSHGGGGHGGGGHGGFGSSGSRHRVRTAMFPGAMRYVYYENRMPHYVYSNYDLSKKQSKLRFFALIVYIPFFISIFGLLTSAVHNPKKLNSSSPNEIVISDKAYLIDSKASLKATLSGFQNKTGITPAVFTVYNDSWQGNYANLEYYAYDLYVNNFSDENHWLIVYSTPRQHGEYEDWYWEGMQGDNTDDILTSTVTAAFNAELQKNLTARSRYTVGEAVVAAFQSITPSVMNTTVEWPMVMLALFMTAFFSAHAYFMLGLNPKAKKYQNAVPCPLVLKEQDVCEYCGGVYVVGTVTECPHCGAGLKPHNFREVPNNPTPYHPEEKMFAMTLDEILTEPVDETVKEPVDEI